MIVGHLNVAFFSDFQYGFRSSLSTSDLLTAVSDRIARGFKRCGATWAVTLDISKAVGRVWHAGLLHKLRSHGISGQIFGLISSFLSNRQLGVGHLCNNIQLMLKFLKGLLLVLHFSYYVLITFLMLCVILLFMLMILLSSLNVIRHLICCNRQN